MVDSVAEIFCILIDFCLVVQSAVEQVLKSLIVDCLFFLSVLLGFFLCILKLCVWKL